jgi:hypothetical protein
MGLLQGELMRLCFRGLVARADELANGADALVAVEEIAPIPAHASPRTGFGREEWHSFPAEQ